MNSKNTILNARKHLVFLMIFISSFVLLPSPVFPTTNTFNSDFNSSSSGIIIYNTPISSTSRFSSTAFFIIIAVFLIMIGLNFVLQASPRTTTFKLPPLQNINPDFDYPSSSGAVIYNTPINRTDFIISRFLRILGSCENHTQGYSCGYLGLVKASLCFNEPDENHISLDIHSLNSMDSRTGILFTSWIQDHVRNNINLFLTSSPENLLFYMLKGKGSN